MKKVILLINVPSLSEIRISELASYLKEKLLGEEMYYLQIGILSLGTIDQRMRATLLGNRLGQIVRCKRTDEVNPKDLTGFLNSIVNYPYSRITALLYFSEKIEKLEKELNRRCWDSTYRKIILKSKSENDSSPQEIDSYMIDFN